MISLRLAFRNLTRERRLKREEPGVVEEGAERMETSSATLMVEPCRTGLKIGSKKRQGKRKGKGENS